MRKKKPVTITIWNYYNGEQLEAFNRMVQNFNDTVGKEQGITVESASQGSVNDLETNVLNAAEGKVGAEELPNIFSGYADTAYELDQQGMVVDLNDYLTESEKASTSKAISPRATLTVMAASRFSRPQRPPRCSI